MERRDNRLMNDVDLNSLASYVLWSTFALAIAVGALAQRTRFCTMGAWINPPPEAKGPTIDTVDHTLN